MPFDDFIFGYRRCTGVEIYHGSQAVVATFRGRYIMDWGSQAAAEDCINLAKVIITEFAGPDIATKASTPYATDAVASWDHDRFNVTKDEVVIWLRHNGYLQ